MPLTRHEINIAEVILQVSSPACGATCLFIGRVRDINHRRKVEAIEYEAFLEMAEAEITALIEEIQQKWSGASCAIRHRLGRLLVSDIAVVIAVSTPHRKEAFAACQFAIDQIKVRVPIWKKEFYQDGSAWIEG